MLLLGQLRLLVHVDLADEDVRAFGGYLVHHGGDHAAGAAPAGPEVQEHGLFAALYLGCEIGSGYLYG